MSYNSMLGFCLVRGIPHDPLSDAGNGVEMPACESEGPPYYIYYFIVNEKKRGKTGHSSFFGAEGLREAFLGEGKSENNRRFCGRVAGGVMLWDLGFFGEFFDARRVADPNKLQTVVGADGTPLLA